MGDLCFPMSGHQSIVVARRGNIVTCSAKYALVPRHMGCLRLGASEAVQHLDTNYFVQ